MHADVNPLSTRQRQTDHREQGKVARLGRHQTSPEALLGVSAVMALISLLALIELWMAVG